MFNKRISSTINIEALPEEIWRHLIDFAAYSQWNPLIAGIEGEAIVGSQIKVTLHLDNGKTMVFKPTVKEAVPGESLIWLGRTILPGLLDGAHSFTIEKHGKRASRFIQAEVFSGFLVPLLPRTLLDQSVKGFDMFNEALKERTEGVKTDPLNYNTGADEMEEADKSGG